MKKTGLFASAISTSLAVAALAIAGTSISAGAAAQPAIETVAGSVAPFTSETQVIGTVAASRQLSIQLWLQPRTAAATLFAQAVSTPGSPQFHHYLSPDAYTERFAATQTDASTVESWLRAEGFTAVRTDPQRSYVSATATASTINRAFDVRLDRYKSSAAVNAGPQSLWSNNRPISLPARLADIVLGVTGLNNVAPADTFAPSATASSSACSAYYGQHLQGGLPAHFGRTSFPTQVCGYSAKQLRAAYAMAPAVNELVINGVSCGGSDPYTQGLLNAIQAVLAGTGHHPLASIVSNSWTSGDEGQPASVTKIEHVDLLQAAAEGVGMYVASGDRSGVNAPPDDPYAIAVGGTTLGIGQTGHRLFETGWSTDLLLPQKGKWLSEGELYAAGGGPSALWKQPAYQRGVVPAALSRSPGHSGSYRSVPDISADADPFTGMAVGVLNVVSGHNLQFSFTLGGGISQSTPLVAGLVAAAQQGSKASFGFLNPVLYELTGTRALHDAQPLTPSTPPLFRGTTCTPAICGGQGLTIFDDQSTSPRSGFTGQITRTGYDNMTGVGVPAGQQFIAAVRALEKQYPPHRLPAGPQPASKPT